MRDIISGRQNNRQDSEDEFKWRIIKIILKDTSFNRLNLTEENIRSLNPGDRRALNTIIDTEIRNINNVVDDFKKVVNNAVEVITVVTYPSPEDSEPEVTFAPPQQLEHVALMDV